MKGPGWLAVVLFALATVGCAPNADWISRTLTLVDVTGRWEGTLEYIGQSSSNPVTMPLRLTLQQNGPKVKGEALVGSTERSVEGGVSGQVFSGQLGILSVELTVTGNEMTGPFYGQFRCPCRASLRRAGAAE